MEKDVDENGDDYILEALELYDKQLDKQTALEKVIEYDKYLKNIPNADYVYEYGYEMLLGKNIPGSYLNLCNFYAVFLMVILSIPVWAMEKWYGMNQICNITLNGKKHQIRAKKQ